MLEVLITERPSVESPAVNRSWASAARDLALTVKSLHRDGYHAATEQVNLRWVLFCTFLFAMLLDAATTLWVLHTGIGMEANPAARWAMGAVGTDLYIGVMTVLCMVVLPPLALFRPRSWEERVLQVFVFMVCLVKLGVGFSNLHFILK